MLLVDAPAVDAEAPDGASIARAADAAPPRARAGSDRRSGAGPSGGGRQTRSVGCLIGWTSSSSRPFGRPKLPDDQATAAGAQVDGHEGLVAADASCGTSCLPGEASRAASGLASPVGPPLGRDRRPRVPKRPEQLELFRRRRRRDVLVKLPGLRPGEGRLGEGAHDDHRAACPDRG